MTLLTGIAALALMLTHLFCFQPYRSPPSLRPYWFSAAGGIAVAYVFIRLLPELEHHQRVLERATWLPGGLDNHAYLLALIGLSLFYGLERAIRRSKRKRSGGSGPEVRDFWLHIGAFGLYNALVGYLLIDAESAVELTLFTIALALHLLVNDNALRNHHQALYDSFGRWVMVTAIFVGWSVGVFWPLGEVALAVVFATVAGGIVLNGLKEELPEERESRFIAFAGGASLYAALLLSF